MSPRYLLFGPVLSSQYLSLDLSFASIFWIGNNSHTSTEINPCVFSRMSQPWKSSQKTCRVISLNCWKYQLLQEAVHSKVVTVGHYVKVTWYVLLEVVWRTSRKDLTAFNGCSVNPEWKYVGIVFISITVSENWLSKVWRKCKFNDADPVYIHTLFFLITGHLVCTWVTWIFVKRKKYVFLKQNHERHIKLSLKWKFNKQWIT